MFCIQFRPLVCSDYSVICHFVNNSKELSFVLPQAQFPLSVEALARFVSLREMPTVMLANNQPIAFACVHPPGINRTWSLAAIMVDNQFRGLGFGQILTKHMINRLREMLLEEVHVACCSDNVRALLMYQRLGFTPYTADFHEQSQFVRLRKILNIK